MNLFSKFMAGLLLIVLVAFAWMFRWEIVPSGAGPLPAAYRLNRWTDEVYYIAVGSGAQVQIK